MKDRFLSFYRGYGKVLWAFAMIAGIATFAIMWIIDANALLRKVFNAPLSAGTESVQSLLTAAIMLPFGYAMFRRDHVNTVFLTSRLSTKTARYLHIFWMAVGFVLFLLVTYGTFQYAMRAYTLNEQVWGANVRFPIWPAKMAISLGTLLLSIQCLLDVLHGFIVNDDELHDTPAEHAESHVHA